MGGRCRRERRSRLIRRSLVQRSADPECPGYEQQRRNGQNERDSDLEEPVPAEEWLCPNEACATFKMSLQLPNSMPHLSSSLGCGRKEVVAFWCRARPFSPRQIV